MNNIHLPPFPHAQINNNVHNLQLLLASTGSLLRVLVLACIVVNCLLFLSAFLALGVRYVGMNTLLVSLVSCAHTVGMAMVLSPHITNSESIIASGGDHSIMQSIEQILRYSSQRYTDNPLAYGAIMGGTAMLITVMHAVSAYYGGIAQCVASNGTRLVHNTVSNNMTSGSAHSFDSYGMCGSSGPVNVVSFLSSILSWLYLAVAVLLYTRRVELLGEQSSSGTYQYDEIGESVDGSVGGVAGGSGRFAGDFPSGGASPTTLHV
ncbi:hypothetical protein HJC23_011505 [Cyclotella cryptica]|uniref:Membrane-associated protein n=1 Tax=Cyclotella cryptica TaxID=29204 RepID=A0ABD3PUV6_9STRA|eukprot:CCRYP_011311-RA/>CCRYP_011311-RA protein AED:0.29 eAED:0.29 QI:362/1/1/1/0/0/3/476/263